MCTVCMMTQSFDPQRHAPGEPVFADVEEKSDASTGTSTAYTMVVGDTFHGTLSGSSDSDWVRVELTAGVTYEFAQDGGSLSDPYVYLYNESGSLVARDDDGGPGWNALLEYTPTQTGTYFVAADAFLFSTGSYELSFTQQTPPADTRGTIEELSTYLLEGPDNRRLSYNTNEITVDITGLNADGRQLARWAMEAWEMVANIDFVIQTDGAGNEMITADDEQSGAFAYFPNRFARDNNDLVELNVADNWLDREGTTLDSYSFQTYLHEFGHALGLNHLGDYNGQSITYANDAVFSNDSWQLSVMSYFSQIENTTTDASYAFTAGAMMADILAIQEFYGAPDENSATAGDTTYGAGSNLGNYMDQLFGFLATGETSGDVEGNLMAFTIYDRDGFDTFNFSFTQRDARLDLRDGQFSDFGSHIGVLGIAQGTVIEDAVLGSGNDTVTGNAANNTLVTNAGRDSITADAGDDRVFAGSGSDTVFGGAGNDTVWGGDGQDLIYLGAGNDLFYDNTQGGEFGSDTVYTGAGNDTIEGGNGNDVYYGENGNDVINGRLGADLIFGGGNSDTISSGAGSDTVDGGDGRDLVYLNAGNDVFTDNEQDGENGQDTVFGGFGDDTLEGGSGNDMFFGQWGRDEITGGLGDDAIFGGAGADTIDGGFGDDTIYGGAGRDEVFLGMGNDTYVDTAQSGDFGEDTITGGDGADLFIFGAVISHDTIMDFHVGEDRLEFSSELVDGRNAQAVEDQMFTLGQGHVLFSAGEGHSIYFDGLTSLEGIAESIDIF